MLRCCCPQRTCWTQRGHPWACHRTGGPSARLILQQWFAFARGVAGRLGWAWPVAMGQ